MADEMERHASIGKDMMNKKRRIKRDKNRKEVGGNDDKFKEWQKANNPKSVTEEDIDDPDLPDDVIEVPVITIGDGGRTFKRDKFYTEVIPPAPISQSGGGNDNS
jgi:hypothetical protein